MKTIFFENLVSPREYNAASSNWRQMFKAADQAQYTKSNANMTAGYSYDKLWIFDIDNDLIVRFPWSVSFTVVVVQSISRSSSWCCVDGVGTSLIGIAESVYLETLRIISLTKCIDLRINFILTSSSCCSFVWRILTNASYIVSAKLQHWACDSGIKNIIIQNNWHNLLRKYT